jgi:molecular chaperone GrpE
MKQEWEQEGEEDRADAAPETDEAPDASASKGRGALVRDLEQKTREAAEANDKYLRVYADFDNYRKRMQRDINDFRKYANEQLALELLTVVDHMGLALKHSCEAGETSQGLQQGVELVYKQLRDVLEKFGIKKFEAEGEAFDPAKHEALMQVEKDDVPANTVVQVFQDGYLYHDKVLRHAKVGVSRKPQPETVTAGPEE